MANNENYLDITELDFEGIKTNLKNYLKSKSSLSGYDFEGSSMNILMDILAYNTHYAAFYASMVGNEMFLDSASKKDSVVSHAKMLNYVPRSTTSARAVINLQRTTSGSINRGDTLIGTYKNDNNQTESRTFTFLEDYEYTQVGTNNWRVTDAVVSEGFLQTLTYVYDERIRERKFLVPSNADISTIRVKIRQSAAMSEDDTETWYLAKDFTQLGEGQRVFFLQAAYDGQYEVFFGDGVLGKRLNDGNLVYIEYLQSGGEEGNFYSTFVMSGAAITTVSPATGGGEAEDVTSIRKNAVKAFSAQNRSVTAKDYESTIYSLYPQAETVKVWGGEENNPPQYGKVFVSIKPTGGLKISDLDKRQLSNSIKEKSMVGIVPEIVDPEYLYAFLTINTNFDPSKTSLSRNEIGALQRQKALEYFDEVLEKFDVSLYTSKLNKLLDEVDSSILGTQLKLNIEQQIRPSTIYPTLIDLRFYNRIYHPYNGYRGGVRSSLFGYKNAVGEIKSCYIEDNGNGLLSIVSGEGDNKIIIVENAGEVDYFSGNLTIFEFMPNDFGNTDHIKIRITPESNDIFAMKNKIITTNTESIYIEVMTNDEVQRNMRGASKDFTDSLSSRGILPEGPVLVSPSGIAFGFSPYTVPTAPFTPPLPNSVPITLPTLGRI